MDQQQLLDGIIKKYKQDLQNKMVADVAVILVILSY